MNNIHLAYYYLKTEYRGKKIGEKIISFSIEYFQNTGFNGISAKVNEDNITSFNLLKKLGFYDINYYSGESNKKNFFYLIKPFKEKNE
ncbi:GNAT family N-acetyltransferase [Xenorhabdus griffiniae]|uniref:GNAT family N-acetyltransferase n=1 Tax=Xenorhabdus griffiniae TaxID=351672 RepID=UPI001CB8EB9E